MLGPTSTPEVFEDAERRRQQVEQDVPCKKPRRNMMSPVVRNTCPVVFVVDQM